MIVAAMVGVGVSVQAVPLVTDKDAKDIKECRVISEPGSYVLVKNLPGDDGLLDQTANPPASDGDCLVINVNDVSIDGNGYTITGDGSGDGIRAVPAVGTPEHIQIRNVRITGFVQGVDLEGAFFSVVENVSAVDNLNHGITIHSGQSNRVSNNNAVSNDGAGIRVSMRSIVTNNIANGNAGTGLFVDTSSVVTGNIASMNGSYGIHVGCVPKSVVAFNTATENVGQQLLADGCQWLTNAMSPPPGP